MTPDQITALAREYAESRYPEAKTDEDDFLYDSAVYVMEDNLRWLLRRFCLAEKEKLDNIYQGILVQLDPKNFGYSPYNQGRMDVIKSIFPEIAKEVQS